MIKNRKCLCCQSTYSYCPDCSRSDKLAPSWKSAFCSESCMTLWTTLTKYGMNRLTKSEAKSIISELDLKPVDSYVPCVKRDLSALMAEEKKSKRAQKIVEPEMVQEQPEVVESHEVVENE